MIRRLSLINRHVDLSHIQSVGSAYFNDMMGSGGWFVGFSIEFILRDKAIHFDWPADAFGSYIRFENNQHEVLYEDETWDPSPQLKDHGELMCLKILNERIKKDILKPWKAWKNAEGNSGSR